MIACSETVKLDGGDTYYEAHGSGEPLLLLHGWAQSSSIWKEYTDNFSDKFRVFSVDLYGHGRSSPFQGEFSLQKAADNLLQMMDYIGIDTAKAVGFSYGGETLLNACVSQSGRFTSMILIGSSHRWPRQKWGVSYDELDSSYKQQLSQIHIHGDEQIKQIFDQMPNYESVLTRSDLKRISTNTLIMVGEHDQYVGPEVALDMHNSLSNSHLWIVPHAGHVVFSGEMKSEFIRVSREFLSGKWDK
ncbi:MAG: alpha/beta hydrolase [Pseudomonadota bacterium]